jgi:hypothetical protein
MSIRRFQIGQVVGARPALTRNFPGGSYHITKQLPENNGEWEYRIRGMNGPHERVVRESQLQRP